MIDKVYSLTFYEGEEKFIEATVVPVRECEKAVVLYASYELSKNGYRVVVERGNCETDGNKIRILLKTDNAGTYNLKITAKIGKETVIQRVAVNVER